MLKMCRTTVKILSCTVILALLTVGPACSDQQPDALDIPTRREFTAVIRSGGLGRTLTEVATPITLFAPNDRAIAAARRSHPELFDGPDAEAFLAKLHLVTRRLAPGELRALAGRTLHMAAGLNFEVTAAGDTVTIGGARVGHILEEGPDLVVYGLDGVLSPTAPDRRGS